MSRLLLVFLVTALSAATPAFAQEDEAFHERLEFDPDAGEWVELPPPIPGTEEGDLAVARSWLARGEYKKARKAFKLWFKLYPDSLLWPEALFYAAEVEVLAEDARPRRGDLLQAYEWLEQLMDGWPGGDLEDRALRKELIIAEMLLSKQRKQRRWGGLLWLSATDEALDMLNRIIDLRASNTEIAEQALRLKADYHYVKGEFEEAESAYARLMRTFPRGRYRRIAMLRSGRSALARFPGVEFDEADLLEAEVYLRDFREEFPQDAENNNVSQTLDRITETRAHKEFTVGQYYERTGAIDAAAFYFRLVLREYPETTWAAEARNRLVALGALAP